MTSWLEKKAGDRNATRLDDGRQQPVTKMFNQCMAMGRPATPGSYPQEKGRQSGKSL